MKTFDDNAPSAVPVARNSGADVPNRRKLDVLLGELFTLGVLATVCMGAGLALNQLRNQPLPLVYVSKEGRLTQAVSRLASGQPDPAVAVQEVPVVGSTTLAADDSPKVVSLAEFRAFVEAKRGPVLDARPEIFHRLGHVPSALSLSREEFESAYAKQRALLESSKDKHVAIYCSSASCEDSQMVADALTKLGYRHVLVYKGGWDEWTQAGLPQEHR